MTRKEFVQKLRRSFFHKAGYINPLPEDADEQLDAAEQKLCFSLPPIVRYIYKCAGEDFLSLDWSVKRYVNRRRNRDPNDQQIWPAQMLPIANEEHGDAVWLAIRAGSGMEKTLPISDGGGGICICLDCSQPRAPVLIRHGDRPAEENPYMLHFEHESPSFVEFLKRLIPRDDGGYA